VVLTADTESSNQIAADVQSLLPLIHASGFTPELFVLPSHDFLFEATSLPDPQVVQDRLTALEPWLNQEPVIVVAPISAFAGFTVPADLLRQGTFVLRLGEEMDFTQLTQRLTDDGYERVDTVETVAQFSVRGGIMDVFPPTQALPLRVELFGDEIVSMRQFNPDTQRSAGDMESCEIVPPRGIILTESIVREALPRIRQSLEEQKEVLKSRNLLRERDLLNEVTVGDISRLEQLTCFPGVERYMPHLYPKGSRIIDFVPEGGVVFVDDLNRIQRCWERTAEEFGRYLDAKIAAGEFLPPPLPWFPKLETLLRALHRNNTCELLPGLPDEGSAAPLHSFILDCQLPVTFQGQMSLVSEKLKQWQAEGRRVICSTHHPQRLMELFRDADIGGVRYEKSAADSAGHNGDELASQEVRPGELRVSTYGMVNGFEVPEANFVLLTDAEVFGWSGIHRRWRKRRERSQAIRTHLELTPGDYIVHIGHGIGQYHGVTRQKVGDSENEYLLIQYAGTDRLFVPVHQIDRIQKYIGAEHRAGGDGGAPALNSLTGNAWEKAKRRAITSARDIAEDLAKLYAERESAEGHSFAPDSPWQRELEVSFDWEETPDQARAIEDVKADMETSRPMDRLICGDVGYGKTEVALRAAFKAVQDGTQVAVLVPTTVLAQQHYTTFRERLAPYPVKVELLSRFRNKAEQEQIVKGIRQGTVDIVVATHRLLSRDVTFSNIGLIVVDEEHRFGVEQKEKLKQLRTQVDVLTLTATPIPRTLHMALGGIREMSVINDPPRGRLPVRTHVMPFDDDLVRTAILREMERGGQVYMVHNRVRSIRHVAAHIARLVPSARIAIGHGQLAEDELEEIMYDFYNGKYDVLVCTTIIESGLDIPNANALIVDRCEQFGLAQLYQLRGRVGRSDRQAYAYLLYGRRAKISHKAEQRIEALQEFAGLGSGYKIALRDLEIRGAGNLLGAEQHGYMQAVGFDLYCQMLSEAVSAIRHEPVKRRTDLPEVDLPLAAYLPEDYIENLNHRLELYQRLATVESLQDVDELEVDMKDRFGVLPIQASNLLRVMRLRVTCPSVSIERISRSDRRILLHFNQRRKPSEGECMRLYRVMGDTANSKFHVDRIALNTIQARAEGLGINPQTISAQQVLRLVEGIVFGLASWRAV